MSTPPIVSRAGDLARRVTSRQNALGLSTQELARRAGMDVGYLEYFERSADASTSGAAVLRLADALDTTAAALVGGEVQQPPGEGRAAPHPRLETLSREDCQAHLAAGGVGRIVFSTAKGPVALPVNFASQDGDVLFRTDDSTASAIEKERIVSFEVDCIDEAMSAGWSVLVTGSPCRVEDSRKYQEFESLDTEPWAGGKCKVFMRIAAEQLSGRVIVQRDSVIPAVSSRYPYGSWAHI